MSMLQQYLEVRNHTLNLCAGLIPEDYVLQPAEFVSPAKWHLAHSTWFFEEFVLKEFKPGYVPFNTGYSFLFNSYYESKGQRTLRHQRGQLSRPSVNEIVEYRAHVDHEISHLLGHGKLSYKLLSLIELGLQHEQQHQELFITDIKYCLSLNPLDIKIRDIGENRSDNSPDSRINIPGGIYTIGFGGDTFCFDNELAKHPYHLNEYTISNRLVTNSEWLQFINDSGYTNPLLWHSEGWAWLQTEGVVAPLYWSLQSDGYYCYTLNGTQPLNPEAPVCHISYYEAYAFARWSGQRLPTEFEWEVAADMLNWGSGWEWTESAYLPYPGYRIPSGAIGEYNGKFMVNQMVLRGASLATPAGHSRKTYRNFFNPHLRWQFTALRLVKN